MALHRIRTYRADSTDDFDDAPQDAMVFIRTADKFCKFAYDPLSSSWKRVAGRITTLDANSPVTMSNGILAFSPDSVEVNLCSVPQRSGHFDITGLSGLTQGKPVVVQQAVGPYAGKGTLADEAEMDQVLVAGTVIDAATVRAYWIATGPVIGNFKFTYMVAE